MKIALLADIHANLEAFQAVINDIKKFVHISTDEVYGSIKEGLFKENDPLKPNSPYSSSKAAAEMIEESVDINKFCPTPSRKQQWPRTLTG